MSDDRTESMDVALSDLSQVQQEALGLCRDDLSKPTAKGFLQYLQRAQRLVARTKAWERRCK